MIFVAVDIVAVDTVVLSAALTSSLSVHVGQITAVKIVVSQTIIKIIFSQIIADLIAVVKIAVDQIIAVKIKFGTKIKKSSKILDSL